MNRPGMPGLPGAAGNGARLRNFGATWRRLLRLLASDPLKLSAILVCTVSSVVLSVLGPWQLGRATDLIVAGVAGHAALDYAQLARVLLLVVALYAGASGLNWDKPG